MTIAHVRGKTEQSVRNKARVHVVITKITKLKRPKVRGMNTYSVHYHRTKRR
jgi:hypothetical protein